jgi:hypothetical protein
MIPFVPARGNGKIKNMIDFLEKSIKLVLNLMA